ncbi:hypothetical protein C7B69_07435 [filamentous cyanobacterium Phorm 46]|nr:hypothetical protein C7B69_07435 [filamentous cyanobacterium Phorm 46]PSB50937.1 hypothetical protein C7B67_12710 [filamentous cyanobacterium Phorm 6]
MLLRDQIEIDSQYDRHASTDITKVGASFYLFAGNISDTAVPRSQKFDVFLRSRVEISLGLDANLPLNCASVRLTAL